MSKKTIILIVIILVVLGVGGYALWPSQEKEGGRREDNIAKKEDLIKVTTPQPNDAVSSPLIIEGEARGSWFFEGDFEVRLLDANNNKVGFGIARAQGDWMTEDFVPFKAEIEFDEVFTTTGTLILIKENPSGLEKLSDELSVPVRFAGVTESQQTMEVDVYFSTIALSDSDCSATRAFTRTILKTKAVGTAALNKMLKGEKRVEGNSVKSVIPKDTKLLNLNVDDGIAYARFSEELQDYGGGSCNVQAIRAQIENTLKQFPTVDEVVIEVEGIAQEEVLQP